MEIRKISLIAIQERYLDTITKQVKEILGDKVDINSITVKDLQNNTITSGNIVVISTGQIQGLVSQLIPKNCPIIIAKRDINYTNTRELLNLPPGQQILVVNDNKRNAEETVQSLRETIFEHNYQAYSSEDTILNAVDYIVTPGERNLLPGGLTNVIDIGARLLDISTFEEIVNLLEIDYPKSQIVKRYLKACVSLSGNYNKKTNSNKDAKDGVKYQFNDIISVSESMKKAVHLAQRYSSGSDLMHIHIDGNPGTGKSMFVQAIHNYSNIEEQSFVSINCTSKDINVIEEALFGSDEGEEISYGVFELAENGTVCLEEIGELPFSIQERLYQVLEKGEFLSLASKEIQPLYCRVISTSSVNCEDLIEKGLFHRNLYNLLYRHSLRVPALSERMDDLLPLIDNIKQRIKRSDIEFTEEVIEFFRGYNWEGNVKELYNVITYLSLLEADPIGMEFLPFHLRSKIDEQKFTNIDLNYINSKIEEHGFLDESIEILSAFYDGKKVYTSYGRKALKKCLEQKGLSFSEQQLRMRLEVLQELGLTIVRQGRAGSTISRKGEEFLEDYYRFKSTNEETRKSRNV